MNQPYIRLSDGNKVAIRLGKNKVSGLNMARHLEGGCFCSGSRAGEFFRWPSFSDFINDPEVQDILREELEYIVLEVESGYEYFYFIELEFDGDVGFDQIVELNELSDDQVLRGEVRPINGYSAAATFLSDEGVCAEAIDCATLVLYCDGDKPWMFFVEDLYPGYDAGDIEGDMTKEHKLVWLDKGTPGDLETIKSLA